MITSDHGYKKNDFECPDCAAGEIHSKVNHLLSMAPSEAREEYLVYKERKREAKRQSWPHFKSS